MRLFGNKEKSVDIDWLLARIAKLEDEVSSLKDNERKNHPVVAKKVYITPKPMPPIYDEEMMEAFPSLRTNYTTT